MRTQTSRRSVALSALAPRGRYVKARLWAYSYRDIAHACGLTVAAVKKACQRRGGRAPALDPGDIASVAAFVTAHRNRSVTGDAATSPLSPGGESVL